MGMIEDIKEAVKIVQQIDNMELYRKLLDLQVEALDLSEQLKNKDKKIDELEKAFELKGKIMKDNKNIFGDLINFCGLVYPPLNENGIPHSKSFM